MHNIEDDEHAEHQGGIKDVQVPLVAHQRAVVAAHKLSNAEDGAHHDEQTGDVEGVHVAIPLREREQVYQSAGIDTRATVEDDTRTDEEAEKENLDGETDDDERFPELLRLGARHQTAT